MPIPLFLRISLCFILLATAPSWVRAHHEELPFEIFVAPQRPSSGFEIHWDDLLGPILSAPTYQEIRGPFHGDLVPTPEGFRYVPSPSLWQVKVDSFVLDYQRNHRRHTMVVAIVMGQPRRGVPLGNDFDDGTPTGHPSWLAQDPARVIRIENSTLWIPGTAPKASFVYARAEHVQPRPPERIIDDDAVQTHAGSTTTGTGGGVLLDPPPRPFLGELGVEAAATDPPELVFYAAGPSSQDTVVKGLLKMDAAGLWAQAQAKDENGDWHLSHWASVPESGVTHLEIEYDYSVNSPEVARLLVDGVEAASTLELEAGDVSRDLDLHRFGMLAPQPVASLDFKIESAEIYRYRVHGEEEPGHTDDFESGGGGISPQWTGHEGYGLAVSQRSFAGRSWLRADLAADRSYLVDATPDAAPWARLRFDIDPSAMNGLTVDALTVYDDDFTVEAGKHLRVSVRNPVSREPLVRVSVKDGAWHHTGWHRLDDGRPSQIQLTFRAASAPGMADGEVQVWVDGTVLPPISGLANAGRSVDTVHFGAVEISPGSTGYLYFDNYQLWIPHGLEP